MSKVKFQGQTGSQLNLGSYFETYLTQRLYTWYQDTTQLGAFNDPSADDLDQKSRSNVKKWLKSTKWAMSRMLFHLHTSYLVPRYNPIRHIQ